MTAFSVLLRFTSYCANACADVGSIAAAHPFPPLVEGMRPPMKRPGTDARSKLAVHGATRPDPFATACLAGADVAILEEPAFAEPSAEEKLPQVEAVLATPPGQARVPR
jgi:hypothetical protein